MLLKGTPTGRSAVSALSGGEVQTNIHLALGCRGVVTDGSVRDIDQMATGFFVLAGAIMPSRVCADIAAFDCPVTVAGWLSRPAI